MLILAADTSGGVCSAAVLNGNCILSESYMNAGRTHSETIAPMIDFCLSCAGCNVKDIDLFACAAGPGSFTGLRIGIGMIKAFSQASGKPAVGVNTLDALARNVCGANETVCPIIDARRGEVYTASYKNGKRITKYRAVLLDDVLEELNGTPALFLGDAAVKYKDKILASGCRTANEGVILQRAGSVGLEAYDMYLSGKVSDAFSLEPFYLRETQAERVLTERGKQ